MSKGGGAPLRFMVALAVTLLVVAGAAHADAPEATVTARAPVTFPGAADVVTGDGTLLVQATTAAPSLVLDLSAGTLNVTVQEYRSGCVTNELLPSCVPTFTETPRETSDTLADAIVQHASAAREDLVIAWTVNPEYRRAFPDADAGRLTVTHGADANGRLGVAGESDPRAHGYENPWRAPAFPSDADFAYRAAGVDASVDGWTRLVIHGVDVNVRGTDTGGAAVEETIRTGTFVENEGRPDERHTTRYLVLEAANASGLLSTSESARLQGNVAVTGHDGVVLEDARGNVTVDGKRYAFDGDTARFTTPVHVTPVTAEGTRDGARLALAIAGEAPILPAADEPRDLMAALASDEAKVAAAAGAVAAGSLLGALAFAYQWPHVRWFATLPLLPLYSRIQKGDVLTHEKREEIYGMIREEPGIHAHAISSRAEIGWGTTVYHLRLLEEHRLVTSKRVGRYRRFYVTAGAPAKRKDAYAALRNDTTAKVAEFVLKNPGAAQKEVCAALGISPSLANWHVNQLESSELVKKVRDGRRVRYYAGPAWSDMDAQVLVPAAALGGDDAQAVHAEN